MFPLRSATFLCGLILAECQDLPRNYGSDAPVAGSALVLLAVYVFRLSASRSRSLEVVISSTARENTSEFAREG